jgi:hypothetical protein
MEDKPKSFYDFLSNNVKNQPIQNQKENVTPKKIGFGYKALAWIVIFISNSLLAMLCWNYGISKIIDFPEITFFQSIMVYTFFRILTRGMFTVQ